MVPADSDKVPRVSPYSGYFMEFITFRLQDFHLLRFCFPANSTMLWICNSNIEVLQPQSEDWFGLFPFRSPLLRESIFLSFPPVTKMFQFTGLLLHTYVFSMQYLRFNISEFPHSEIPGSKLTYSSPRHIVVCHVLHQLLVPRHSLWALSNLITISLFILMIEILMWYTATLTISSRLLSYITTTLSSFQRTISWENNLSKLSKTF